MSKQMRFDAAAMGDDPRDARNTLCGYFAVAADMLGDADALSAHYDARFRALPTMQRLLLSAMAQKLGDEFKISEVLALKKQGMFAPKLHNAPPRQVKAILAQMADNGILQAHKMRGGNGYAFRNAGAASWLRGDADMAQSKTLRELNDPAPLP